VCDDGDDKHTVRSESSVYDEIQCEPRHQCQVMIYTESAPQQQCVIYTWCFMRNMPHFTETFLRLSYINTTETPISEVG